MSSFFCFIAAIVIQGPEVKQALAGEEASLKHSVAKIFHEYIESLPTPERKQIHRRQEMLQRTISATFHYKCPHGGQDRRYFVWKAVYSVHDQSVEMLGLANIDKWSHVLSADNAFGAFFYHSYCKQGPSRFCTYHFRAWTQGEVYRNGITLELDQDTADVESRPTVSESCILLLPGVRGLTCAAFHATGTTSCIITRINLGFAH